MSDDPSLSPGSGPENPDPLANDSTPVQRLWRWAVGAPRSLQERGLFHSLALAAFLAWVGLGADGLSSSAYGPEEAFRTLGEHRYLAVPLAVMMAGTVFLISAAYSRIIEVFPHGGGGYVVASKLLGERIGVVSGSALLVDYVLTITISIAASGDAIFSLLPVGWQAWKMPFSLGVLALLTLLNLRGVKESVTVLVPIFLVFLVSHVLLILTAIGSHAGMLPETAEEITTGFRSGMGLLGAGGMLVLLLHAYSLGGGTYTGIEAVSNGLAIMREPKVQTARRTMMLMALSLAFTATGLLVSYLLWDVAPVEGRTLNAVLTEKVVEGWPLARTAVIVTLASEGLLLVVAAQAGFLDGPRVLANMAVDSWAPHRFSALSDRLPPAMASC